MSTPCSLTVTSTETAGIDSGRRRYRVECLTCEVVVHRATTGPAIRVREHLDENDPSYKRWRDRADTMRYRVGHPVWAIVPAREGTRTDAGVVVDIELDRSDGRIYLVSVVDPSGSWRTDSFAPSDMKPRAIP